MTREIWWSRLEVSWRTYSLKLRRGELGQRTSELLLLVPTVRGPAERGRPRGNDVLFQCEKTGSPDDLEKSMVLESETVESDRNRPHCRHVDRASKPLNAIGRVPRVGG